jgi:hypothetical protein
MMAVLRLGKFETSISAILYPPVIHFRWEKSENDPFMKSVWIFGLPRYHDLGHGLSWEDSRFDTRQQDRHQPGKYERRGLSVR